MVFVQASQVILGIAPFLLAQEHRLVVGYRHRVALSFAQPAIDGDAVVVVLVGVLLLLRMLLLLLLSLLLVLSSLRGIDVAGLSDGVVAAAAETAAIHDVYGIGIAAVEQIG